MRPRGHAQLPQRGALPSVRRADGEEVLRGTRGSCETCSSDQIIKIVVVLYDQFMHHLPLFAAEEERPLPH